MVAQPGERSQPKDAQKNQESTQPSRRARIGLVAAERRLGFSLPTGEGVVVGHVEGGKDSYLPNMTRDQFKHIRFVQRSGESKPFGHANVSGQILYGRKSLAPGIRTVHGFAAQHWIGQGYLRAGSRKPPVNDDVELFNHSWIANAGEQSIPVLRRVDYQIDERGVTMCVGVNNGADSKVPHMLASAYNAIAVGSGNGQSSGGYTRIDGEGRCKPDLVAPRKLTSFATPMVTACAARLLQAGRKIARDRDRGDVGRDATRPEVIKATLMAGATKPDGWQPEQGKPLDQHYGAGMVNIDHSLEILNTEPTGPGQLRRSSGWDYRAIEATRTRQYRFSIDQSLDAASLILTWHRKIDGTSGRFRFASSEGWSDASGLANFDLTLIRLDRDGNANTVARSASDVDNVEHLYREDLEAGRYRIKVTRRADGLSGPWPYALAWRMERR